MLTTKETRADTTVNSLKNQIALITGAGSRVAEIHMRLLMKSY